MRMGKLLTVLLLLMMVTAIFAQSAKVKGRIMDSSGSVMPGVQIKVYQGEKVVKEGTTSGTGDFEIPVDPGEYKLEMTAPDFDTYAEVVKVTPDMGPLTVTMQLAQLAQNIEVTETRNEISIDPDSSLNTTVLSKEFVDALPDDEDELTAYLQQIAGSRGGAGGGGSFVIDGFSGGRVPPKDQIQEIRINNNPFSSEFSGIGYGRVEIITKAGTGDYHGNLNFFFKDESLNARNPFAATKPPYQQRNFNSNFNGPIIRNKLSLNLNVRNNVFENSDTIRAILPTGQLATPVVMPNTNRALNARSQWAMTKNNTMFINMEYQRQNNKNQGVGGFNLQDRAATRAARNMEFQMRETAVLTKSIIHETRFQFRRDQSQTTPKTTGTAFNVLDSFFAGGGQNKSSNQNRIVEFGNMLMYSGNKWTVKTGMQSLYRMYHTLSENNFIGTFTFSSLADYIAARPVTFTKNQGDPRLDVNQLELGTFLQNDWKLSQKFNLSFGVRYEAQTNISDHNNFDPRMGFGFQLTKTTALRGGAGVFHQRLDENIVEQLVRLDGTHQQQIVIRFPSYPDPFLNANGTVAPAPPSSLRVRAADLSTPYNINSSISIEQQLPKGLGLTLSWDSIRGAHLYRSRNINAPLPGAPPNPLRAGTLLPPDPMQGNINQLESTGLLRSNNYTIGFRELLRNKLNLTIFGNYTLGYTRNDTDGPFSLPANNYDLRSEWGRSPQDTRHRIFTGANFRLPWDVNVNTQLNWSSSRPYNITTGLDDNGDTVTNDRPAGLARNTGIGPGNFNLNMNLQKTVKLKNAEKPGQAARIPANPFAGSFAEPQRGGGFPGGGFPGGQGGDGPRVQGGNFPGGQRGGPGGNRGPGGRGPNGGFGQQSGPTMTFIVNFQNILNNQPLNGYSGVMPSPFFGRANSARNPRQIEAGLRFNF